MKINLRNGAAPLLYAIRVGRHGETAGVGVMLASTGRDYVVWTIECHSAHFASAGWEATNGTYVMLASCSSSVAPQAPESDTDGDAFARLSLAVHEWRARAWRVFGDTLPRGYPQGPLANLLDVL